MAVPYELLLYPELLTNEQLITIIHQRHLRMDNMESMSRFQLLEVFRSFCVPYGQRKHRDTGRGKMFNKSRYLSPEPAANLNVSFPNNNQSIKVSQSKLDRLKPPPDHLCGKMKRIKLETNITIDTEMVNNSNTNTKRKMSVDSTAESPPSKKEKKAITWP